MRISAAGQLDKADPGRHLAFLQCRLDLWQVEVLAEVGDWYKVRWHKRAKGSACDGSKDTSAGKSEVNTQKFPAEEDAMVDDDCGE